MFVCYLQQVYPESKPSPHPYHIPKGIIYFLYQWEEMNKIFFLTNKVADIRYKVSAYANNSQE